MSGIELLEKKVDELEEKIDLLIKQQNELKLEIIKHKKKTGKKNSSFLENWDKLSEEVTNLWKGNPDAVEEVRYQRRKNE